MTRFNRKDESGFTLMELMVVVAIIGILASIAIPSFLKYQNTSKRAEVYANLGSLVKAQKAFYAEYGDFIGVLAEPTGTTGTLPNPAKRAVTGVTNAFARVGWTPDGDVFYDYDTNTTDTGCLCVSCFTAAAYGDLDGNGNLSVVLYAQPDPAGAVWCQTALVPQDPPLDGGGNRMFNQVVRSTLSDEF